VRFELCYMLIINLHYLCYGSEMIHFECVCVHVRVHVFVDDNDNVVNTLEIDSVHLKFD